MGVEQQEIDLVRSDQPQDLAGVGRLITIGDRETGDTDGARDDRAHG
jgi:hypothetical protein